MSKYWLVFKLSLEDTFEYRFDNIIKTFRYAISILFLALVWIAIARESPNNQLDINALVTYYVFAACIYSVSNYHLDYVEEDIRLGYISKYMVKPLSPFWFYCIKQGTQTFFEVILKTITLIPLLLMAGYSFHFSWINAVVFVIFLPIIFLTTFTIYFACSSLAFWFQSVDSLRMSIMFVFRFLSGIFVPLTLLPHWYYQLSIWLPFQHVAFTPIQLIRSEMPPLQAFYFLGILIFWLGFFLTIQKYVWWKATHSFESTGL